MLTVSSTAQIDPLPYSSAKYPSPPREAVPHLLQTSGSKSVAPSKVGPSASQSRPASQVITFSSDDEYEVGPSNKPNIPHPASGPPKLPLPSEQRAQAALPSPMALSPPAHSSIPSPPSEFEIESNCTSRPVDQAPVVEEDPIAAAQAQVLQVLSDCQPSHVHSILILLSSKGVPHHILVETCLGEIFDSTEPYPKAAGAGAGKRKRSTLR